MANIQIRKTGRPVKMSNVEKAILITLIGGALLISPMAGPLLYNSAKRVLKKWWEEGGPYVPPERDPDQVRDSLYKLRRNEYIKLKYDSRRNVTKLELTSKGRKFFEHRQFEELKIPLPEKWDGRWHMLMFDIPEKSRTFRNALREKLKALGFFQIQKSVWIYPFECEKEMKYVCEFLGVKHFALMFTVRVENDAILRKHFIVNKTLPKEYFRVKQAKNEEP